MTMIDKKSVERLYSSLYGEEKEVDFDYWEDKALTLNSKTFNDYLGLTMKNELINSFVKKLREESDYKF